ncbi:MAG: polysaccharide biosynthesis tyrosine autokinase [Myxococcota bacterium]|nr:polysaccharide biosynthesis tyrosine autokinase [Myxococcota bacterium]
MAENNRAADAERGASGIDIRQYLLIGWTYKWLILGVATVVAVGVTLWTLRQPKVYAAVATIEYDPSPTSPLGREVEDVASPVGSFWTTREFFATQNRIIGSRAVAERVVQDLGLHRDPSFFYVESFQSDEPTVEQAARVLQGRLSVEPIENTRIVAIRVVDRDPDRAATLANAVAESYIAKTLEDRMGSTVSALEWLGTQLDTLRHQLDESELSLHRFKEEHNILSVSMEDRQNLVASDIQHFNEALTQVRTKRIELQARANRIRDIAEAETPEESASAFPDNETIGTLREQLRGKAAEREGLSVRYGPNHQRMQQLAHEIDDLRRQLREEVGGVLRAAEADVREAARVESGIRSALEDAHSAGLELNLREIEYSRLNRQRENNAKLYDLVLERTTETDLTRMLRTTHARLLDRALRPSAPISPKVMANVGGGVGAGLVLALGLAFLLSRLDRRLKSVADVEGIGLTVLGILPRIEEGDESQPVYGRRNGKRRRKPQGGQDTSRDLFVHTHPMSAAAECCRTIRTNLTFMSADDPIRAMVITSASPREGKTTVTTNIAISLAQSGKRVLMVDTDLRRPRIHRAFGVSGARGVTSVIVGEEKLEDLAVPTDIPNLDILPCGPIPPNPSELLHSHKFQHLIDDALRSYDRVIFDSPPLGAVTDAAVLAPQLDAALIVVKAQSTTRDALSSALRQLRDVGANVVGGVLNDLDPRRKGYGAGEYYYYYRRDGYYAQDEDDAGTDDDARGDARPSA